MDGENTFSEIIRMFSNISPGVVIVSAISLIILILWETKWFKNLKFTKIAPGPLVIVITGIILNKAFAGHDQLAISSEHLVSIPVPGNIDEFLSNFMLPDFSALSNLQVYITAIVIAVVASLETLLSVEAIDKLDPLKRITPTNRELRAQGIGNILSGLIGGLPVTQVIVRSSANQQSGGKTKVVTIIHGFLLLISIILIPKLLNMIPLATLAAILLVIGYKLAKPALFKKMYAQGRGQFYPFVVTILGIVFTDLLIGIGLGMVVAISIILYNNYKIPYKMKRENLEGKDKIKIVLSEDVTFLNKASILKALGQIPDNTVVEINATNTHFIHHDVCGIIEDFKINAQLRDIKITTVDLYKGKREDPLPHFELKNNGNIN